MRNIIQMLVIVFLVAAFWGCDAENNIPTDSGNGLQQQPPLPSNTPPIPTPTAYDQSLPGESDKLVVEESALIDFIPEISMCSILVKSQHWVPVAGWKTGQKKWIWDDLPINWYDDKRLAPQGDTAGRLLLVHNKEMKERCYTGRIDIDKRIVYCYPRIRTRAFIRKVRFWKKLVSVNVEPNAPFDLDYEITTGIDETNSETLTKSIGGGLSITHVPLSLNASLSQQFTSTEEIHLEIKTTHHFHRVADPGTKIMYGVWQLIERYEVVDVNGRLWTDARYNLASSETLQVDNFVDEIRQVSAVFDSNGNPL